MVSAGRILASSLFLTLASPSLAAAPRVLLIWDVKSQQTEALARSLKDGGSVVVFSDTDEIHYDGKNPSPADFDVVVHLNGTTHHAEMTLVGQQALTRFVREGGGYLGHEWNAYELSCGRMQTMRPLILFDRTSGYMVPIVLKKAEQAGSHPVVWEVPQVFTMTGSSNIGRVHKFEQEPAIVLARDQQGNDAIAVREYGLGRVVNFHHGGNWEGAATIFDSKEARRLFVDSVRWAYGCDPSFREGHREKTCAQIEARRKQ
ncbi:MAG: hlyA 2 [Myxococcaceae bacterium]|nr:hlyA 2 [Myxococcaceae bacterium]